MSREERVDPNRQTVPSERFVQLLTSCQGRLYAYILTLIPDSNAAKDVLQQTNLVVWRKAGEFDERRGFHAWICRIAYYEALGYWRNTRRDRHLFDDELLGQLAEVATRRTTDVDSRQAALEQCLSQLKPPQRDLIRERYGEGNTVETIGKLLGMTAGAMATRLFRLRQVLQDCIERKLATR